uniref:Outer membrane protein beta-barrel domain-containing protein n=1 Tax=Ignavibacterium album TaxID=591197 RepID=A0A832G680_9BACT
MKKIYLLLLIFNLTLFAQENNFFVGVSSTYNFPVGQLAKRLEGNFGFLIYAGKPVSSDWTWIGKLEYFKLTDVNKTEMKKFIKTDVLGSIQTFEFSLPKMEMNLTAAGLTAEAKYKLFRTDLFDTDINLGFGFYFWEYFRNSYKDSLTIDTTGNGNFVLIEELDVPSLRQKDWSGSINFGTDFNLKFFTPFIINLSVNYKIIIAELWPTLALNLENVSGLQFLDLRAGIKYEF